MNPSPYLHCPLFLRVVNSFCHLFTSVITARVHLFLFNSGPLKWFHNRSFCFESFSHSSCPSLNRVIYLLQGLSFGKTSKHKVSLADQGLLDWPLTAQGHTYFLCPAALNLTWVQRPCLLFNILFLLLYLWIFEFLRLGCHLTGSYHIIMWTGLMSSVKLTAIPPPWLLSRE